MRTSCNKITEFCITTGVYRRKDEDHMVRPEGESYSGAYFTSTNSWESREDGSHFQRRTAFTAACASTGCPPLVSIDFTDPSEATSTSSFTTPSSAMVRANAGYGVGVRSNNLRLVADSCPWKNAIINAATNSVISETCRNRVLIDTSVRFGPSTPKIAKVMVDLRPVSLLWLFCVRPFGQAYLPCSSRNFSTSIAAMQPVPAAVIAWR